jgi:RNA polymerase sigma factor (TIGR02999 family)
MTAASKGLPALLEGFRRGDKVSIGQLMEQLYPELRRLAAAKMRREKHCQSWQPTLLVNELYLELVRRKALGGEPGSTQEERAAFLGLAGFLMRRLLILHSRPLRKRVEHAEMGDEDLPARASEPEAIQTVEQLLARLEAIDPKLRTVVEMRVFEGKTHEEIAACLECTSRTVGTYWTFARRWLQEQMGDESE